MRIIAEHDLVRLKDKNGQVHYINKDYVYCVSPRENGDLIIDLSIISGGQVIIYFDSDYELNKFCQNFYKKLPQSTRCFSTVKRIKHIQAKEVINEASLRT